MKKYPVAIIQQKNPAYPENPPYHAPRNYPEYPFKDSLDTTNNVYNSVRETLRHLGYDAENYNTPHWNPLGWLISPGETIFVKPNMIAHKHFYKEEDWDYVITHGSVIRAIIDFAFIALQGNGRIILGDAPQTDSKIDKIFARMGLREIQSFFKEKRNFEIELVDLRDEHTIEEEGIIIDKVRLPGDPRGSVEVDLAHDSYFAELDGKGKVFYGALYDVNETNEHHGNGVHQYSISKSPIVADVFINVPKLKTHKKCGLTVNLKSLVGINANKNWLPHYVFGSPETGGDQFNKTNTKGKLENTLVVYAKKILMKRNPVVQLIAKAGKKIAYKVFGGTEEVVRSGNWHGNDTVWRMSLDLNRILMYANPDGTMRKKGMKKFFSVVDGVIAMERNGPVAGVPKNTGVIIAGDNPVSVDSLCAMYMGMDYRKLALVNRAFDQHQYALIEGEHNKIDVKSNKSEWNKPLEEWKKEDTNPFIPHFGWVGQVELE